MNRLEAIKQRLQRYTNPDTNTDEKLEEGSISEWVCHADGDMAWLVERVEELTRTGMVILHSLDHDQRTMYVEGLVGFRTAIRTAIFADAAERPIDPEDMARFKRDVLAAIP